MIQDGIEIRDHVGDALHITGRHPNDTGNAIVVDSTGGPSSIDTPTTFGANMILSYSTPIFTWYDAGASANNHYWRELISAGTFVFQAYDDGSSTFNTALQFIRSGATITGASIPPPLTLASLAGTGSRPVCATSAGLLEAGSLSAGLVTCP
jgi:hypothetical protein